MKVTKMENLKEILQKSDRYKNFTILDNPVRFKDMFAGENIDVIQIHSVYILNMKGYQDIVGFCGQCVWKDNILSALDGDSYSDDMLVYGYEWFTNEKEDITKGLDILVEDF